MRPISNATTLLYFTTNVSMPNNFFQRLQNNGLQDIQNRGKNIARKISYTEDENQQTTPGTPAPSVNQMPQEQATMQPAETTPPQPLEDPMDRKEDTVPLETPHEPEMMDDELEDIEIDDYEDDQSTENPATLAAMTMARKRTTKPSRAVKESTEGRLTVDVYETPKEIVIKSAVAGVSQSEMKITITPEAVSITGERKHEDTVHEDSYFYQECFWGSFSRSIILPTEIDPEKAKASLSKGVLTIRLPKLEKKEERTLVIEEV